jgi:hypothetical protein
MEVIVHRHESMKLDRMLSASVAQEPAKVMPVLIVQEYSATIPPPLSYAQRDAG